MDNRRAHAWIPVAVALLAGLGPTLVAPAVEARAATAPTLSAPTVASIKTETGPDGLFTWLSVRKVDISAQVEADDPDGVVASVELEWIRPDDTVYRTVAMTHSTDTDRWIYTSPQDSNGRPLDDLGSDAQRYGTWTLRATAHDTDGADLTTSSSTLLVKDLHTARHPRVLSVRASKKVQRVRGPKGPRDWQANFAYVTVVARIHDPDRMVALPLITDKAPRRSRITCSHKLVRTERRGDILVVRLRRWAVHNTVGRHRLTVDRSFPYMMVPWNGDSLPGSWLRGSAHYDWWIKRP